MAKKNLLLAVAMAGALLLAGCANLQSARHEYIMRGQVLEVTGDTAYICIGKRDGAQVGQEFTVLRFVKSGYLTTKHQTPYFKKEETGRVKIEDIVDEHYSDAKVLSGSVKVNDVVELSK